MKLKLVESQKLNESVEDTLAANIIKIVEDKFEGTDFSVYGIEVNGDTIRFDVTAIGPDGPMERNAEIVIPGLDYVNAVSDACDDWMSDHSSPDSFYESAYKDTDFINIDIGEGNKAIHAIYNPNTKEIIYTVGFAAGRQEVKTNYDKLPSENFPYTTEGIIKAYIDTKLQKDLENQMTECDDNSEATQPEDIAKKAEYRKLVQPDFKVGSKI